MEGNITKILWIAIGALFFVAVVSIAMMLFNQGKETASTSMEQISKLNVELSEADLEYYNGKKVSGSEVMSVIKKYRSEAGDLIIQVRTNNGITVQYNTTGTIDDGIVEIQNAKETTVIDNDLVNAQDSTDNHYINPTGEFIGFTRRDVNDVIRAIEFGQQ